MSLVEKVYRKMPIPVQSLMITAKGATLAWQRYGREYRARKAELPKLLARPYPELQALQLAELRKLIAHARARSPYYARTLRHVSPDDIRSLGDLKQLPVLEKEVLRGSAEEVYTIPAREALLGQTGGTTGKAITVRYTRPDFQRRMAELDFFRESHGARHRMRRATFTGKHIVYEEDVPANVFWRTNWVLNQRFYSTFHMSEAYLQHYVDDLNRFRPQIMDGFGSCIVDVCTYVMKTGQRFSFQPVAIFSTSEPLYSHQREVIRSCLGVEPRDQYASSEGAPFITECTEGQLHYQIHTGVIEADENGEALVTSFTTYGTPLIRYRIGDRIVLRNEMCSCGWNTPLAERIEGRASDYLLSPSRGKIYAVNMANALKELPHSIVQAQFVQRSLSEIQVNVVVDPQRFEARQKEEIVEQVRRRLGAEMGVEVVTVPNLDRASSGKQRLIINELA